ESWYKKLSQKSLYKRIQRIKQFIMDNYVFNLDLDTWGLTSKEKELSRFSEFVDQETLSQSNALFGYEGDKYYFDMDIRRHFGLDKYNSNTIPYWKTETIEAMEAFKHKEGYPTGAGECVSLAALYAASMFVLGGVPLDKIYMLATPLHSQNFIDINDGIITNNRRIVTKNMWFNGTELSAKARRALENERVTIVCNNTGHIHIMHKKATISKESYIHFTKVLREYLKTDLNFRAIASFLRQAMEFQKCFQFAHNCCGKPRYIAAEKVFHYEHSSKARIGESSQTKLIHEIDEDEFYTEPLDNRIILNDIEAFCRENEISIENHDDIRNLKEHLGHSCYNVDDFFDQLISFCRIEPNLPDMNKDWETPSPIELDTEWSREEITKYLHSIRESNLTADLAFTAFREISKSGWKPFLKAAIERNPVSVNQTKGMSPEEIHTLLRDMPDASIYSGNRLAQPDEVWNFRRGDGMEKGICLINILKNRSPGEEVLLQKEGDTVNVAMSNSNKGFKFTTEKDIEAPGTEDFSFQGPLF
ncbi:MAG: hypothetical protein ACOCSE_04065, partial [Chitinivibrionales bacterium]